MTTTKSIGLLPTKMEIKWRYGSTITQGSSERQLEKRTSELVSLPPGINKNNGFTIKNENLTNARKMIKPPQMVPNPMWIQQDWVQMPHPQHEQIRHTKVSVGINYLGSRGLECVYMNHIGFKLVQYALLRWVRMGSHVSNLDHQRGKGKHRVLTGVSHTSSFPFSSPWRCSPTRKTVAAAVKLWQKPS